MIGLVQVKGGAGRSTLATNLAGELSKRGKTILFDCDLPQGTSASWYAVRQDAGKAGNLIAETASTYKELVAKIEQHPDAAYIVLDSPPRIAEMTRAVLVLADLCLVPVGASKAEIWATGDILELFKQAERVKPVFARMIWTRYRPQTKLAQELTALASAELGIKPLESTLGMRVAYIEALGDGKTVAEMSDTHAKHEVLELTDEVLKILVKL